MADTTSVNTKKAPHRELNLETVDELSAELDRLQSAHESGTLAATGNWASHSAPTTTTQRARRGKRRCSPTIRASGWPSHKRGGR